MEKITYINKSNKTLKMKILPLIMLLLVGLSSCASTRIITTNSFESKDDISAVSFTTIDGEVIYTFLESEVNIFRDILNSSTNENLNPVTSPAWNKYLKLTYASKKIENYFIYDQYIIQQTKTSPKKYFFKKDIFWLYNKARSILGEESKEYQKFPKRS